MAVAALTTDVFFSLTQQVSLETGGHEAAVAAVVVAVMAVVVEAVVVVAACCRLEITARSAATGSRHPPRKRT